MNVKQHLQPLIPQPLLARLSAPVDYVTRSLRLLQHAFYDLRRFARYSGAVRGLDSQARLGASITRDYHKIEKALTLPSPRVGFGSTWIEGQFLPKLDLYVRRYGVDDLMAVCRAVLTAYREFHNQHDRHFPKLQQWLEETGGPPDEPPAARAGGIQLVEREALLREAGMDFATFCRSRHSVRDFSPEPVAAELIERAVALAQRSPSVCNRQGWHVYAFTDRAAIQRVLAHQHGHQGFGEKTPALLLVTADLACLLSIAERNQGWIDGGLFSMSLVYALHSLGLGTCCLNLCIRPGTDKALRHEARLAPEHSPVMMIAVGHLPERFAVAQSPRRSLAEVLSWR